MTSCPEHPELPYLGSNDPAEKIALLAIHDQMHHGTATAGPAVKAARSEIKMSEQHPEEPVLDAIRELDAEMAREQVDIAHEKAMVIDQLVNQGLPCSEATVFDAPGDGGLDYLDYSGSALDEDLAVAEAIVDARGAEQRLDRSVAAALAPQQIDLTTYDHQLEASHERGYEHSV